MKILFISRAYPPITGGIENQNYALSLWLNKYTPTTTIANRFGKKALPFFFPYATLRTLWTAHTYDVVLLGDGVLALVGVVVKFFYPRKKIISVVHGLDLTYPNAFYQKWWIEHFIPRLDGLIAVSEETKKRAVEKGLNPDRVIVIPNGVDVDAFATAYSQASLQALLGRQSLDGKSIILTAGRLVKRKGVAWFIRTVLPKLPENVLYLVAGTGPEEANIKKAIEETSTQNRVKLLGWVNDESKDILLHTADIFVQPNIRVEGDMEGFGISVIEATACERPVVASDLEGLKDAIRQNENGILVPTEDAEAFTKELLALLSDPSTRRALGEKAARYTREHFHWETIAKRYISVLETFIKN